jgi:hypothetical protein
MNSAKRHRQLAGLILALLLAGCSRPDPTVILGNWKADSFAIEGLKVPIAPNFEVTRNQLILKSPDGTPVQALALAQIRAESDKIELEFKDGLGISLEFTVERADRVHFKMPFIGTNIAYSKQSK